MDELMNGRMDEWKAGWADGHTDRQIVIR